MPKIKSLCYLIAAANIFNSCVNVAYAKGYFNPAFLDDDVASVADLTKFEEGGQLPGSYRVDVYVNDVFKYSRMVKFIDADNNGKLAPCIDKATLIKLGVNTDAINDIKLLNKSECLNVGQLIPGSEVNYNFQKQQLFLSFPQAWMNHGAIDYVPKELWDNGIAAVFSSYAFSLDKSDSGESYFGIFNSGANYGPWRLRNNSSYSYTKYQSYVSKKFSNINTYVERPLIALQSELVLGQGTANSDVYDSIGFSGVRLYSDDSMYPNSLQGFAPTIRGVASSRARVVIKQNGYVIYQTIVSPGAFELNDLSPTSSSGDLTVTVNETDGSSHSFIVPYSTVPILQREGRFKYDFTAGNLRTGNDQKDNPFFTQLALGYGLPSGMTLYGGTQLSNNYYAETFGIGQNLGRFGAISLDLTQANSKLVDDTRHQGQSLKFLYAKSLNELGTTFQLLGYRYSTKGFYSFEDTAYKNIEGYEYSLDTDDNDDKTYKATSYHNLSYTKKGQFQVSINQNIGEYGSFYASLNQQTYWETSDQSKTFQLGYSGSIRSISYNINWSSTKSIGLTDKDKVISLNVSIPIGTFLANRTADSVASRMYATTNVTDNVKGSSSVQAGVSGTLLQDNNLSYSVTQGASSSNHYSGQTTAQLQSRYGTFGAGYSYSNNTHDVNLQAAGGILAHQNGVTLSQPLGDTNILIKAPGANNVSIENRVGVATDYRGYTVIPYADSYKFNRIALDSNSMNSKTDIENNVQMKVPTRGAIVEADFVTHIGSRLILKLEHNGKNIAFGASAEEIESKVTGIVGSDGEVFMSGLPNSGKVAVNWGAQSSQKCVASYQIPKEDLKQKIITLTTECN